MGSVITIGRTLVSIERIVVWVFLALCSFASLGIAIWPFLLGLELGDVFLWPCSALARQCGLHWNPKENPVEMVVGALVLWGILFACATSPVWVFILRRHRD
jgi:hypothetical protein